MSVLVDLKINPTFKIGNFLGGYLRLVLYLGLRAVRVTRSYVAGSRSSQVRAICVTTRQTTFEGSVLVQPRLYDTLLGGRSYLCE